MVSLSMAPLAVSSIPAEYGVQTCRPSPPLTRLQKEIQSFTESLNGVDPDKAESLLMKCEGQKVNTTQHVFTPGLYSRTIFMDKGDIVMSKVHNTEHQFCITEGMVSVWTKEDGVITYTAPHRGVTHPGTRRILYIHEATVWTTYHPTDRTTVEEVEADIIMKHSNPFLEGGQP